MLSEKTYSYLQGGGHKLEQFKFPPLNLLLTLLRHLAASKAVIILK